MKWQKAGVLLGALAAIVSRSANAETPIVFDGTTAEEAVDQVSNVTQQSAIDFEVVSFEALVSKAVPYLDGRDSNLKRCDSLPTTVSDVREAIDRARSALDLMQDDKALAHLKGGLTTTQCLNEPLDNEDLGELYFLVGFLEHAAGKEEAARAAFLQATLFDENIGWDTYFSPEGQPLFEQAKKEAETVQMVKLQVSPAPPEGSLWVNGRPITGDVASVPLGTSFLQLTNAPVETLTLSINATEPLNLLLANRLPTDSLTWINDESRNQRLEALFLSSFPRDEPLYAVVNGAVWSHTIGTDGWTLRAEAGGASKTAIEASTQYARRPQRNGVITAGISGTSVGFAVGALSAAMYALNRQAELSTELGDLPPDADVEDAAALSQQSNAAARRVTPSLLAGGVFAIAGGAGLVVSTKLFQKSKKRRAELPDWHPYALNSTPTTEAAQPSSTKAGPTEAAPAPEGSGSDQAPEEAASSDEQPPPAEGEPKDQAASEGEADPPAAVAPNDEAEPSDEAAPKDEAAPEDEAPPSEDADAGKEEETPEK